MSLPETESCIMERSRGALRFRWVRTLTSADGRFMRESHVFLRLLPSGEYEVCRRIVVVAWRTHDNRVSTMTVDQLLANWSRCPRHTRMYPLPPPKIRELTPC